MNLAVASPTRPQTRESDADAVALTITPDVRLQVSPEDFWTLCVANRDLRLERTSQGVIELMSPTGGGTGARNLDLTTQLGVWSKADGTGTAFDSSTGFTLPNGAVRSPDASWIRNQRWNDLTTRQKEIGFAPICPDFVVELSSPSDELGKLETKLEEYVAQGARLGWLIDRRSMTVRVYRPGRPVERLDKPATLSGEDVLPGFVLDLKSILFD